MTTDTAPKHYKHGGSVMARTIACPGSPKANAPYANAPAGAAADRGTRIHEHFAHAITSNNLSLHMSGGKEATEANIGILAARKMIELAASHGFAQHEIIVEKQGGLHHIDPDAGGTPDAGGAKAFGDLLVADLKTGYKLVDAEMNWQLIFYALVLFYSLDEFTRFTLLQGGGKVHCYIIQPDSESPHPVHVRYWSFPCADIPQWEAHIAAAIRESETNPDKRVAGYHCESLFCNARHECSEYKTWMNDRSLGAFNSAFAQQLPQTGPQHDMATLLRIAKFIKGPMVKWAEHVENIGLTQLGQNPGSVPGYALADKVGNYTCRDEKALEKFAKALGLKADDYKPRSVISFTGLQNVLKTKGIEFDAAQLAALYDRPVTGQKLVEVSDTLASFQPPQS